ncbi:ABC transporter substrate-binding protein [Streptosporangium lutulentum]|uniref:Iron complex transport system substrate-binding protein n=1 Tax=Streptosporangium lutulentum TaxID=1461250 RepID=A0ABT9Q9U2_9ACTN|nr:ABC transporter substrate-binding protein [Streptosporangium lutulentum]MDP9842854.1 iron complex transport system substrate-binding protein [Streptosporangium lutulentum]
MTARRARPLLLLLVSALLMTGCGNTGATGATTERGPSAANPPVAGFPVTVVNCGVSTTYRRPPQRAVTLNQHATEVMLALGLEKSMVATAYLDDRILPEYETVYRAIKVLAKEYPSYESLLSVEPDFVYGGFNSAFDEKEGRGRAVLAEAGIDSHVNIEGCPTGPVTMVQVEEEIRTIGKIFGVADRAERQIAAMRGVLDRVKEKIGGIDPVKVFVYDSGDKTAFTAGGAGIGNEMIELAGGTNLFADLPKAFGDVSFEQVAERAPEVIVIYDYGDESAEDKKRFLLSNPALKDVPAIKNQRFAVLPLSSTVLGVRVPAGVESLARQLHADRFA